MGRKAAFPSVQATGGNLQVNNVNGGGSAASAACEHIRHKEPNTFGTVLCSALTIKNPVTPHRHGAGGPYEHRGRRGRPGKFDFSTAVVHVSRY